MCRLKDVAMTSPTTVKKSILNPVTSCHPVLGLFRFNFNFFFKFDVIKGTSANVGYLVGLAKGICN